MPTHNLVLVATSLLAGLLSLPVWADWVRMVENDSAVIYIDPDTIRRDGQFRRVWKLADYKTRHPTQGYLSVRALYEYDCKREMVRFLTFARYSEHQARGTLLDASNTPTDWTHVPPGTASGEDLRALCK